MQPEKNDVERPSSPFLRVGQDLRGRWLVQDVAGLIEGCFTNQESALGFAKAECEIFHGQYEMSGTPLSSHLLH